ncbi:MAG: Holliday junction branch migration DNA helicase RuvB [Acidobacteria bacterium]|nr:Holliday junction branch migration DNA helicase RuvB [Acidobacteriota bacterium]
MSHDESRLMTGIEGAEDRDLDRTLRPRTMKEYIGQTRMKENLQVFIRAARERKEPLDHILLYGPPGLGKTTIAYVIAHEIGLPIKATSGPALEKSGDLVALLTSMEEGGLLFIDEIHRLSPTLEEILYQAMEDYRLDITIGQGVGGRVVKLDLPPFTLLGASTRIGLLTAPLRDRFGIVHHLDFYSQEDLARILQRAARILGVKLEAGGADEIARRSRGTPRIANRLLRRVRDFAQVEEDGRITSALAELYLERLEVDRYGLDETDRRLLMTIHEKFEGGPVGLNTLAAAIGEETDTLEEIYEPYLLQIGFLDRTSRGRMITRRARTHLKISPTRDGGTPQSPLF